MNKQGIVNSIKKSNGKQFIELLLLPGNLSCSNPNCCSNLSPVKRKNTVLLLEVANDDSYEVGQELMVHFKPQGFYIALTILYILPLLIIVTSVLLLSNFGVANYLILTTVILLLLGYFFLIKLIKFNINNLTYLIVK